MNYLIHATPVHPSLCLQSFILLFTIATITNFILLLLLLFHYYHHYKTVATDKPLRASLFLGAAKLTTHLLRLINILWLPLCRIHKFGFYFPRRRLRSPILVGHQGARGQPHNRVARPSPWPRHHMVRPPGPPPDVSLSPINSPRREKPKEWIAFPQNIPQAAAVIEARSGGSRSSSRHPTGEGNPCRRPSPPPWSPPE
jgi:hypothetical protein